MGQGISSATIPPPLTLRDCLINGRLDLAQYTWYRRSCELYDELEEYNTTSRKRKKNNHITLVFSHKSITIKVLRLLRFELNKE